MRMTVFCITLLLGQQAVAEAPGCPAQGSRRECLKVAQSNYMERIQLLEEERGYKFIDEAPDNFLMAANDIRHFETQACQKTCVN